MHVKVCQSVLNTDIEESITMSQALDKPLTLVRGLMFVRYGGIYYNQSGARGSIATEEKVNVCKCV